MREISKEELAEILGKHQLWMNAEEGGERANLSDSNLSGSNLRGSNLSGSNLRDSNLRGSNLSGTNLSDTNLSDSNLRDSNLRGSNLSGTNLSDSNLSDTNLNHTAGNRNEIKSLFLSETYSITYTSEVLQIGCESHLIADWWEFDNKRIAEMDGKTALTFWKKYKAFIKQAIELSPAKPTGAEK